MATVNAGLSDHNYIARERTVAAGLEMDILHDLSPLAIFRAGITWTNTATETRRTIFNLGHRSDELAKLRKWNRHEVDLPRPCKPLAIVVGHDGRTWLI